MAQQTRSIAAVAIPIDLLVRTNVERVRQMRAWSAKARGTDGWGVWHAVSIWRNGHAETDAESNPRRARS